MLKEIYVQSKIYKSDSHNSYNLNEFLEHRKHVLDFSKNHKSTCSKSG